MNDLIGKLAENSILGVLLAISLIAIYFLFKIIQELQEKRIKDAQEVSESIIKPINQIDQNSRLLITLLEKLIDVSGGKNGN